MKRSRDPKDDATDGRVMKRARDAENTDDKTDGTDTARRTSVRGNGGTQGSGRCSPEQAYMLGMLYHTGSGLVAGVDPLKAYSCFLRASKRGHRKAMEMLNLYYDKNFYAMHPFEQVVVPVKRKKLMFNGYGWVFALESRRVINPDEVCARGVWQSCESYKAEKKRVQTAAYRIYRLGNDSPDAD